MMWCPVVAPRKPPQAPRSSQEATQPAASEPGPSTPLPAKRTKAEPAAEPSQATKGKGKAKGKAAKAKPAPQPGRGIAEMREFVFDPDTQIGVGIDPSVTQAVSAASGVWDPTTGQLMADQLRRWKLIKGQVKHGSGLNNARRDTERWLAPIKPHLQHLAAASSAGTSLEANLKHITVTLATWDAVWEVYLDPKWAEQRLRLYGAQDRTLEQFFKKLEEDMAEVSMERHGRAKQLVVFFGAAGIGTRGGWGADAVLRACCKVVCRPRGTDQRRGRVVLVDEHRTSRVSSAVNGQQPCERQLNKRRGTRPAGWKPPAGQVEPRLWPPASPPQAPRSSQEATQPAASEPGPSTPLPAKRTKAEPAAEPSQPTKGKGKAKGKAAKAKSAPQPGRWVDRDCNAALNMQGIGESKWRPLELCFWPEQGKLPAKGKEYPGLGYKRLRDKPPKAQQQQQPAEAHAATPHTTQRRTWEVYLDPKWAEQRLRLYGAQDRALEQFFKKLEEDMAEVSMERHGRAKQLVVFFGAAGIGTRGCWGADAVLRACCKVVCRPRGTDQRRGRVVLVDEHRTSRVSSAVNGQQPCERQLNKRRATRPAGWKPPTGQVEPRLVRPAWSQRRDQPVRGMMWCPAVAPRKPPQAPRSSQEATQLAASEPGPSTPLPAKRSKRTKAEPAAEPSQPTKGKGKAKGKAAKAKPAPQPGRWVDRDCNAALNMQRIGESRWRPLELCFWPEQGKLPAKGKEYPRLGYKRLRDKPPKAQQQQQQPAEAQ
ncbi:hypothetical protein QJQ45_005299 [Haematococcus lacustris]|nr:hypothetical protein QJQ45_005299 [Haematococcus lacustris]